MPWTPEPSKAERQPPLDDKGAAACLPGFSARAGPTRSCGRQAAGHGDQLTTEAPSVIRVLVFRFDDIFVLARLFPAIADAPCRERRLGAGPMAAGLSG